MEDVSVLRAQLVGSSEAEDGAQWPLSSRRLKALFDGISTEVDPATAREIWMSTEGRKTWLAERLATLDYLNLSEVERHIIGHLYDAALQAKALGTQWSQFDFWVVKRGGRYIGMMGCFAEPRPLEVA